MTTHHFHPLPPDAAGVLSWVHIGDLHMTRAGQQNHLDLARIVEIIDSRFAGSISFVYTPGDVADDGSREAYSIVRDELSKLTVPWCAILGDHDVHERSFRNFLEAMSSSTYYAFSAGPVRFVAMNAFDIPEPPSFTVNDEQLRWAERELRQAASDGLARMLLLHCYPSDLKHGAAEVERLVRAYNVRLVDMGHTHYNEIANDGRTLYTATRSTGQIEEGPVGFSVTSLDGDALSWRFLELTEPMAVTVLSPADDRLAPDTRPAPRTSLTVRVKVWSESPVTSVAAQLGRSNEHLTRVAGSNVWQGLLDIRNAPEGSHSLRAVATTEAGHSAEDSIRVSLNTRSAPARSPRDQDNEIGAWPEHGLLGTQLGPNKNGKKW